MIFTALTVAGSDSGGGAGIQADLHTFSRVGVYGASVIAALTAQNSRGVPGVMNVPADFVRQQWEAVGSDIPLHAMKTGMLGNASNIQVAADMIKKFGIRNVVVDPVMVSTSGTALLEHEAIDALQRLLLPQALLVTPNLEEARVLSGINAQDFAGMELAARRILEFGPRFVLVKGGHLEGDAVDVLFDGVEFQYFRSVRKGDAATHGTGCVLSAAIAAYLAKGHEIHDSVRLGKEFVTQAIATSFRIGKGSAPCNAAGLK